MRILITTGIYPPQIGGPAQYAKNLKEEFERQGHRVWVMTYGKVERFLPTGLRHLYFSKKADIGLLWSDLSIALDTMSVGFPTVLTSWFLRKKVIIRTGGDFLWESYVERTGQKVLFREFYDSCIDELSLKEKIIFKVTGWTLRNAASVVFSTEWQRDIFIKAYGLNRQKTQIIENYYGPKIESFAPTKKDFIAGTRPLKWKNTDTLSEAFTEAKKKMQDISLDLSPLPYGEFLKKIQHSYAVVLVSLGDISPNMIMDAIRANKPFVCTRETGIYERIKDIGVFVDPVDTKDITEKLAWLSREENYRTQKEKIEQFSFTHDWSAIADEFLALGEKLS
jgi:glycosyltransferase involved in cell wall biosynthesis